MTDTLTRTNFRVRFSEVKNNKQVTPAQLIYYFQDSNIFQHEDCGIGLDYLEAEQKAWFILSWQLDIERYPSLGEQLNVGTWDARYDGIYNYRNCDLYDGNGERIVIGSCICVYMDLVNKRPEKITDEITAPYYHAEPLDMDYNQRKIKVPDTYIEKEPFEITPYHIDFNGHVNNGRYIELAQAYLPDLQSVTQLRADYRTSAKLHDILYPRISITNQNEYTVQFCNEKGKPYCVIYFAANE